MNNHIQYQPNPAQERWLRAMRPGRRMFWRSGVGTGKTNAIAFTAQRLAHLNSNTPGLVCSHNLNHVELEIVPAICRYLEAAGTYRAKNLRLRLIYLNNGSTIQWAGAHKPESLDGKNVGWGLGDEVRYWPETSYDKFTTRIRLRCPFPLEGIFTTPELNWIARRFRDNPDFQEIVAKTSENSDNLQPGYYEHLSRSLSPDLYESYVNGEWMHSGGGVFPEFSESSHVQPDLYVPSHPVHIAFDPGVQRSATLFFQYHRFCPRHRTEHCIHVLDECMLNDVATVWAEQRWRGKYYEHGWRSGKIYLDAAGDSRSTSTGLSDVAILESAGWECVWTTDPFKRAIVAGIQAIKGKLRPFIGTPSLYFDPRLLLDSSERGVIRSIRESRYHEAKGSNRDDQPIKDGILDHVRDALRYAIVNLCPLPAVSFVQPAK